MGKRIKLRPLTANEEAEIRRLAAARSEPVRLVQRAQVIAAMLDDPTLAATEAGIQAGYSNAIGAVWVRRFNEEGVAGLADRPRAGRPPTHDERVRSALIDLALHKPRSLGLPFALWTLERLQSEFKEQEGVHLSDSTIWSWLDEEGLQWKRQESWFHEAEQDAPLFVEKRGPSSGLIAPHQRLPE